MMSNNLLVYNEGTQIPCTVSIDIKQSLSLVGDLISLNLSKNAWVQSFALLSEVSGQCCYSFPVFH